MSKFINFTSKGFVKRMIRIFGKGTGSKGLKDVILVLSGVGKEDCLLYHEKLLLRLLHVEFYIYNIL